ncbi:Cys-tRNA(Pro) deacylase [Nocardioides pyridinolyticus]
MVPQLVAKRSRTGHGGTPATVALTRAGIEFSLHEYEHDPRAASFGLEAAEALGLDPVQVFKTLMATVDGRLTVGIVPVSGQLDLKALARAAGGSRAAMADVAAAERATGYVAGGISPVGQKRAHPTVVDESALAHGVVYVSGGRRGLDLGLAPADLVRATGATVAPISRT